MQFINFQCSYKQQLSSRSQEVDSVVLELKGQMAELNEQLSQRSKSLENELAKREQQVYIILYAFVCVDLFFVHSNKSSFYELFTAMHDHMYNFYLTALLEYLTAFACSVIKFFI